MKKISCVAITITIALLPALGFPENKPQETPKRLQEKKIVMIIAQRMFQETEFKEPKEIFEKEGATVIVASSKLSTATGGKLRVQPDILITDIKAEDYDAVVFIGGFGVSEYVDDYQAHKIANEVALEMVCSLNPSRFITHRFEVQEAGRAYELIDQNPQEAIQVVLTYD